MPKVDKDGVDESRTASRLGRGYIMIVFSVNGPLGELAPGYGVGLLYVGVKTPVWVRTVGEEPVDISIRISDILFAISWVNGDGATNRQCSDMGGSG